MLMNDGSEFTLLPQEQDLIDCVRSGRELVLLAGDRSVTSPGHLIDERRESRRIIRATTIRELLLQITWASEYNLDPRGISIYGAIIVGRIDLVHAKTALPLKLENCHLLNGIDASNCEIPGISIINSRIEGPAEPSDEVYAPISLNGSVVLSDLCLSGSYASNTKGCAVAAEGISVRGNMDLNSGFVAEANHVDGAVYIPGARVEGHLSFSGSKIVNTQGSAIFAEGVEVQGDMYLREPFRAESSTSTDVIRLPGAKIGGQLSFTGARVVNGAGPAIVADSIMVVGDVYFRKPFFASARSKEGAILISGAKVDGQLSFEGSRVSNDHGPIVVAPYLHTGRDLYIDINVNYFTRYPVGAFDFRHADVEGKLSVSDGTIDLARKGLHWRIDGMSYRGCPASSIEKWTAILALGSCEYTAQPFRFFAEYLQSTGHGHEARKVLIEQQKCRRIQYPKFHWRRLVSRLLFLTVGYGYRPLQVLIWFLPLIVVAFGLVFWWLPDGLVASSDSLESDSGETCSAVQRALVAIDISFPLVATGVSETCAVDFGNPPGDKLSIFAIMLKIPVWVLVAFLGAGLTSVIRKE